METWSSVLSEFAFWLWAEMDPANRECLTSQAVRGIWVGCGCSLGKRYQRSRTCLTGEVESPSSPIRRQAPDVKYPIKGSGHVWPDRIPDVRYPEKVERRPDRILPRVEWAMLCVARGTVCMRKGERESHVAFFREDPTGRWRWRFRERNGFCGIVKWVHTWVLMMS